MSRTTPWVFVGLIITALAIFGAYEYPKPTAVEHLAVGSPAGSTFNTSKVAEESLVISSSTVYSVLNGDTADRIITDVRAYLSGGAATTSTFTLTCATSSNAYNFGSNANKILVASTTPSLVGGQYIASSSPGVLGTTTASVVANALNQVTRVWASGSYLVCTNVSSQTPYNLYDSNTTGFVAFHYLVN